MHDMEIPILGVVLAIFYSHHFEIIWNGRRVQIITINIIIFIVNITIFHKHTHIRIRSYVFWCVYPSNGYFKLVDDANQKIIGL